MAADRPDPGAPAGPQPVQAGPYPMQAGPRPMPPGGTLVAGIRASVRRNGGRTAVRAHDGTLPHAALWAQATRFAAGLAAAGVQPGELVLLLGDRSTAMIAGLLGTLMHGAAYTIVDEMPPTGLEGLRALRPDFVAADTA